MLVLMLGAAAFTGSAQVRWGVEAGVNISHALETSKTKAGFNAGATAEYSFNNHWFMDAALKLSSQPCGDKYDNIFINQSDAATYGFDSNYTPYYLTLPVRAGYKLAVGSDAVISLAAGPAIGVGLFGKTSMTFNGLSEHARKVDTHRIYSSKSAGRFSSSRMEYGINVRLGVELKKHYTLGAEYSLFHIPGKITAVDNVNLFSINVGYKF